MPARLEKMHAFWSALMLTRSRQDDGPVETHHETVGIVRPMFGKWLAMFEDTAASLFVPQVADRFAKSARRIAENLRLALFFRQDQPGPEESQQSSARA